MKLHGPNPHWPSISITVQQTATKLNRGLLLHSPLISFDNNIFGFQRTLRGAPSANEVLLDFSQRPSITNSAEGFSQARDPGPGTGLRRDVGGAAVVGRETRLLFGYHTQSQFSSQCDGRLTVRE